MLRIRMIDGFNEGWIEFREHGRHAIKGKIEAAAIAALVAAEKA